MQPIHQDDVTRAIRAALDMRWDGPHSLVIAGPTPLPYADFVRAVAAAAGLQPTAHRQRSGRTADGAGTRSAVHSVLPRIQPAEIRRLLEDKASTCAR